MKRTDLRKIIKEEIIKERNQTPIDVLRIKPLVKEISQLINKVNVLKKEDDISMFLKDAGRNLGAAQNMLNRYINLFGKK